MDDKQLLEKLVADHFLAADQAEKLRKEAEFSGKSAEQLIYDRRLVDEIEVANVKSELIGVPFSNTDAKKISDSILQLLPQETVMNYQVAPLGEEKGMLVVGMLNPQDRRAQEALRFIAKQKKKSLGIYLITPSLLQAVQRRYSPFSSEVKQAVQALKIKPGEISGIQKVKLEQAAVVSEEAPIIKIVSSMLKEAVSVGASDIHVEPQRTRLRIRFRLDGVLQETQSLPPEIHPPIISRIKILSNLKIDETRIPQDGRFRTEIFGREIDFRVSTFPTPNGEKAAIRVLDPQVGLKTLEQLGLSGWNDQIVEGGIGRPYGMVLLTGPTGSGKTTTLYALMQKLNKDDVNIISLEDPVEYSIEGLNQSQVRPEIGYDFASGLRQILRQDPDIMMVGEIRDQETAELAVHAALTGHILLSTLHTNNAIGVIPRLIDLGVDAFLLPPTLNLVLAQRLISRLCPDCRQPEIAPASVIAIIQKELAALPGDLKKQLKFKEPYQIFKSPGCQACNHKGRIGRIALFEVLRMTPQLAAIISDQPTENKIWEEAQRQGMITLRQDGLIKALEGSVAIEEVLRETGESIE